MKTLNLLLGLFALLLLSITAQAEIPRLINYQGKLTTAEGGCVDTTVQVTFSIYPDSNGIDPLWTEVQSSVQVKGGVFSVLLGSVDSIPESVFTGDIRYLGVKVEDDVEMTPRKAIVSVGYAYRTSEADTAQYARTAPPDVDWDTDTSGLNIYRLTGKVGIGTPMPSHELEVNGNAHITGNLTIGPTIRYCTIPGASFRVVYSGSPSVDLINECYLEIGYGLSKIAAPMELPHGATVSEVTVFYGNITASQCAWVEFEVGRVPLFEKPNCPMEVIGSYSLSALPTIDYDSLAISSFSDATIDNNSYSYWIKIRADCWHYWLYAARITFLVRKPLP